MTHEARTFTKAGQRTTLARRAKGLDLGTILERLGEARPVTIVVPVYNGGDAVRRCLDSLLRWTANARLVAIDDASTDPAVVALLDHYAERTRLELVRHEVNQGYTRTANEALHLDQAADVVLLNSDTEVGPMWLQRLQWVRASQSSVATVSAVSDNAGAMAVPVAGRANEWPAHLPWDEVALAAAQADLPWAVPTPTGHGFCMLVSRDAIEALGGFDEERFPRGYGEENDFCMRARELGMTNLVAPQVLVKHARSQSFGGERDTLIAQGRVAVDERHPTYTADIRAWVSGPEMSQARERHDELLGALRGRPNVLPRRLYVLHRSGGGTPATNLDLMTALSAYQDSYLVESADLCKLVLHRVTRRGLETLAEWTSPQPFEVTDTWRQDYAEVIAEWIIRLGIDSVHVRHLINHPLTTLSTVVGLLGLSLVVSTHDFYLVCPSVHLLDESDRFCGGHCTSGEGTCRLPTPFVAGATQLKHRWIHEWQRRAGSVLESADAVIATTRNAGGILASTYPQLASSLTIIEHGRDIDTGWDPARAGMTRRPGPLRVLAVANWDPHKGTEYLRALGELVGHHAEIHVMGQRSDSLADIGIAHGPYQRSAFPGIVSEIDPDLVALVSIWPETYSHTLTEAWALGVPVLATDIGAVAERIRTHGGGVLAPVDEPAAAARMVIDYANDRESLEHLRAEVPRESVRSRAAMAEDYRSLYGRLRDRDPRRVRVGYVVRGRLGEHPGSTHVRVLRRLEGAVAQRSLLVQQAFPEDIIRAGASDLDVLLLQRDALLEDPERLLPVVRRAGTRLVVELDDDLVTDHALGRLSPDLIEDARLRASIAAVLREADNVILSTSALAERLAGHISGPVSIVPNQLDPRLWSCEVPADEPPKRVEHRVLYMGSKTHLDDVMLLRDVVRSVSEALGTRVVLETVGVADRFAGDDWIKRLRLPRNMTQYPDFVRWLRTHRRRWVAGVAPLVDSDFNTAKSDLKLLEYAGLGLPVVASRVGPYADSEHLAVLTDNTPQAWTRALTDLLVDPAAARSMVDRAAGIVFGGRMIDPDLDPWVDAVVGTELATRLT